MTTFCICYLVGLMFFPYAVWLVAERVHHGHWPWRCGAGGKHEYEERVVQVGPFGLRDFRCKKCGFRAL